MRSEARRALGLVLVAVVLMSVATLAATQTFINKTGKTVIGIKIEFSKSVRITRHDSIFPDQSPNGRSQEFTFSGGGLRNLGRFSISWLPSSAKVTDYEWIQKAQLEQEPQATPVNNEEEFNLPDPNTPPILYGDDYPGTDEPLYQPAPDEQIWLTDLDGHGEIYDNDPIVINYAPGFDKSQITKIIVYRNGIRMRFLPEKFDVLTNAQMKTFDGNPAEHSPASNHTDHAIMGYEYKFEIDTADHVWIQTKTVKSGFRWRPKEVWAELSSNWVDATLRELSYDKIVKYLRVLKSDGFTGISFDMVYYVDSPHDSTIKTLDFPDTSIISFGAITASNDDLEKILGAINEAGMDIHVMVHMYISQQYQDTYGAVGQGFIDPDNPRAFFDSYLAVLQGVIPLFNQYHVKLLSIFDEVDMLEANFPDLVANLLSEISREFEGELGIDEATNNMLSGNSCLSPRGTFEQLAKNFTFWGWKDATGRPVRIEYSCWDPLMDTRRDQRASVMPGNFVKFWSTAVDYYRLRYSDNIQMFGEIGSPAGDGACSDTNYWNSKEKEYDYQEAADGWYAQLAGSKALGMERFNMWQFSLGDLWPNWGPSGSLLNVGFERPMSPGYRVITSIIQPDE